MSSFFRDRSNRPYLVALCVLCVIWGIYFWKHFRVYDFHCTTYGRDCIGRIYSEQVLHPVRTGFLSGLSIGLWPEIFGADCEGDREDLRDSIPEILYYQTCNHSYAIFRRFRLIGLFCLSAFVVFLAWAVKRVMFRRGAGGGDAAKDVACAVVLALVAVSCCSCASKLPERAMVESGSALRYYDEAVGLYAARVVNYSDVVHLVPDVETVYGTMNFRRPLLADVSVSRFDPGVYRESSWFRQGVVMVAAAEGGEAVKTAVPEKDEKAVVEGEKEEKPLRERIVPVRKKAEAEKEARGDVLESRVPKEAKPASGVSETMVFYQVLTVRDQKALELLLEGFRRERIDERHVVRLIGHGKDIEGWMGEVAEFLRKNGYREIEMFNVGDRFPVVRDGKTLETCIEVMAVRRGA